MKDEGWKGRSALESVQQAAEFMEIMGHEPVDDFPADHGRVGEAVYIEIYFDNGRRRQQIAIIEKRWVDEDGSERAQLRDPHPGEIYEPPSLTILAYSR